MFTSRRHTISFKHALQGIIYVVKTQPNFQIHLLATAAVILVSLILHISRQDAIILTMLIMFVIVTEMVNTAIESTIDLVTDKYHQLAKVAKDVSAGMVLISAVFAVIIGFTILWPYF